MVMTPRVEVGRTRTRSERPLSGEIWTFSRRDPSLVDTSIRTPRPARRSEPTERAKCTVPLRRENSRLPFHSPAFHWSRNSVPTSNESGE